MSRRIRRRRIVAAMGADKLKALVERRQALAEEIARHPRPITGCDVHFNRLLEERAALSEEIARLETLEDRGDALPAADAHGH